ncbi:bifunctional hydroxymethylpyrimidine kinase/phosphomethylpyrimidine kinase [Litoreibacter roseus]|uniref:hydroxymethylpyrimidine kinase n=1 Tax=Litoreibacter roseus TaxID=2601869 RepID=A0A6N6JIU5_9RHOB|nr:bifunctional hydroxymethylpyrimidine kinase/phosphomethylpyrimidine kinase [Litoreibacter roseus]GFE65995.1 hydroxymethylpyrimidine/phosphomethylpyrimidine kinase [Litoreibacter roseus]
MIPNILSIAGSDPSGGAGIQADLKAISANGGFAMAALTALTAQNTTGVAGVHLVPPAFVRDQILAVRADVRVDAIKIGMIATADIANAVADALEKLESHRVVLDPVMVAKGGASLLANDAVAALRDRLIRHATVLTPNLPEAAALLDTNVAPTREAMSEQAVALLELGSNAVLLKGGHLDGGDSPDCLATQDGTLWLDAHRVQTKNTHGTGCTLSAALATQLGHGMAIIPAAKRAKAYVSTCIAGADQLTVGAGHGPTHHFAELWSTL